MATAAGKRLHGTLTRVKLASNTAMDPNSTPDHQDKSDHDWSEEDPRVSSDEEDSEDLGSDHERATTPTKDVSKATSSAPRRLDPVNPPAPNVVIKGVKPKAHKRQRKSTDSDSDGLEVIVPPKKKTGPPPPSVPAPINNKVIKTPTFPDRPEDFTPENFERLKRELANLRMGFVRQESEIRRLNSAHELLQSEKVDLQDELARTKSEHSKREELVKKIEATSKDLTDHYADDRKKYSIMIHRRDRLILNLSETIIQESLRADLQQEKAEKLKAKVDDLYNTYVKKPCSMGVTCENAGTFLLHKSTKPGTPDHYLCGTCAAELMERMEHGGSISCPQCRHLVVNPRLERSDVPTRRKFEVDEDTLVTPSFRDFAMDAANLNRESERYINNAINFCFPVELSDMPTLDEVRRLRLGGRDVQCEDTNISAHELVAFERQFYASSGPVSTRKESREAIRERDDYEEDFFPVVNLEDDE